MKILNYRIDEVQKSGKLPQLSSGICFNGDEILLPPPSPILSDIPPPPPPPLPPSDVLPHGMQPKKKYIPEIPLKHLHWNKIPPQGMPEKAFWVSVHEEQLASEDIFEILSAKFPSNPQAKREDNKIKYKKHFKKVKELKVLDDKAAKSLLILLGSVKISARDMQKYILQVNEEKLTDVILQQLIKNMPETDKLNRLEQYEDRYNELNEAEQFVLTISRIKRLVPRLKYIHFKMGFHELFENINNAIDNVTAACEEVKKSTKFSFILQMILLIGNYMNTGTRNEQAFGFEINFLTKLDSTKAIDHKTTLLHCLVEIIEKKHPDALKFAEELIHIDKASRVSYKQIEENLIHMKRFMEELKTHLESFHPHNEDDRFGDVMPSFLKEVVEKYKILEDRFKEMEKLSEDLSVYFAFDPNIYTYDEFFSDIKTFKDMFQVAYKEYLLAKGFEKKMQKARKVNEKTQKAKQESIDQKEKLMSFDQRVQLNIPQSRNNLTERNGRRKKSTETLQREKFLNSRTLNFR